jgi:nucleoside 2-deoxyribosyltransferase
VKRLYLAGPDVFAPDPMALGARKMEICARHGLEGIFPMGITPWDPSLSTREQGLRIFNGLERVMRDCDGALVNMTPFHGPSMDVGSAFEMGFMRALHKPVFAYSNTDLSFLDRVRTHGGTAIVEARPGVWHDAHGMEVDPLGWRDNLMIDGSIERSSGIHVAARVPDHELYTALESFEACVKLAAEWFSLNA